MLEDVADFILNVVEVVNLLVVDHLWLLEQMWMGVNVLISYNR